MTWVEWQKRFNDLFGAGDWVDDSVASWIRDVFVPGGITPEEMLQAAIDVARGGPPDKPHQILTALNDAVRARRADAIMARATQERLGGLDETIPTCRHCDGSGWVIVPHCPQPAIAAAKGYLATHAVRCRCGVGQRASKKSAESMTLDRYESDNADWRDEMAWWKCRSEAEARVGFETSKWDELVTKLLKSIERRMRR